MGLETGNVYLGNNALRVTKTTPAGTGGYCQDNTGVAAGSWCTLSAYVKVSGITPSVEGGGAGVYASFWKYTESGGLVRAGSDVLGQRITENTSADGWDHRVTVTFQVPAGTEPGIGVRRDHQRDGDGIFRLLPAGKRHGGG